MKTQDARAKTKLIRTSVLVSEDTDSKLRSLAKQAERPLSYEIRRALERYVKEAA